MSERPAIVAPDGTLTYPALDLASRRVAAALLGGRDDLEQARVAFFVPPSCAHVAVQRGIWRAGGVAVPLALSPPPRELEYVITDAAIKMMQKEESDTSVLQLQKAALIRRIEAAAENRSLLDEFPDDIEAANRLGKALTELGDLDGAAEAYQKALAFDATNVIAKRNLQRIEEMKAQTAGLPLPEVVEHLHGARGLAETIALVKTRTWQFARRQGTWFRRQLPVKWLPLTPAARPEETVRDLVCQSTKLPLAQFALLASLQRNK